MKRQTFFKQIIGMVLVLLAAPMLLAAPVQAANEVENDIVDNLKPIAEIYDDSGDVDANSLAATVAKVIQIILGFLGIVFLALIVYAGLLWMTSAGNEDKVEKAKKIMSAAVIGAVIVFAAYIITYFVLDTLVQATGISESGLDN
jgi:uncharacterized membrane protein